MLAQSRLGALPRLLAGIPDARTHALILPLCLLAALALTLVPHRSEAQVARDPRSSQPESHVLLAEGALTALPPATIRRWQVGVLRPDRLQHGSTSFALAVGAGIGTENRGSAFAISLGIGLLKECWDARHGRFDTVDLAADATGALLGALTTRSR